MRTPFYFFILLGISLQYLQAQTSDINKGCIPLNVNFTAPQLSDYYWDFNDGNNASISNANHIFTKPGTFQVNLFEGKNGRLVGTIPITVYADPVITFTGTPISGCSPLQVVFTSSITNDPAITIKDILWSFGDGNSSTLMNPNHTYTNSGKYNVSIRVNTSIAECDKTFLVQEYIQVTGTKAAFTLSKSVGCEIPSTILIANFTKDENGNTYLWDFGNGSTSTLFDPKMIVYNSTGTYKITLKVIDNKGCESTISQSVVVGPPVITLEGQDSFCIQTMGAFKNTTVADSFLWKFSSGANISTSKLKEPKFIYQSSGIKTITLTAYNGSCKTDTTFNIFIDQVDADFTITGPDCLQNTNIILDAKQKGSYTYLWNDSIKGKDVLNYIYHSPQRDSLYRHRNDTIFQSLSITSSIGCYSFKDKYFIHRRPNAILIPSVKEGCAPLKVQFTDASQSMDKIIKWKLFYGDGQIEDKSSDQLGSHVYNKPGEYYVKFIIENIKGCIDTSEGFWIKVGEPIIPTYTIDQTTICLGGTINIKKTNSDPRIDSWHVYSDNGRFSHCWTSIDASHQFVNNPGTFQLQVVSEYNGCFANAAETKTITVKGAKANIAFMTNCSATNDVMFVSKSLQATQLKWSFGDGQFSTLDSLIHHYDQRGTYKVTLSAIDVSSGCPENVDTKTVHIKEIKAAFLIPEKICDNVLYPLDASASQDVDRDCNKGFLWRFPNHRPREVGKDTIMHGFGKSGYQEVSLVVEDINGCKDSITKGTTVYSITPNFDVDKTNFCIPANLKFTDKTKSDTTLVSWSWNFGSKDQNPNLKFTKDDTVLVILSVKDTIGCVDTIAKTLSIYKPFSKIQYSKGLGLCIGETVQFNANDFTSGGSSLQFMWNFGKFGTSNLQNPKIVFDKSGKQKIYLNYEEKGSGCMGTDSVEMDIVKIPEAQFTTALDSIHPICYPAIFELKNNSSTEGIVRYIWSFDKGSTNNLVNPTFAFGKGKHHIQLIVRSIYGCSDTISREYTLIGPEGKISADKLILCKGEEAVFSAIDLVDVNQIEWDFNDGKIIKGENPVRYRFDSVGSKSVFLVLKSTDTGCEHIDSLAVKVPEIIADFLWIDTLNYCPGLALFKNKSIGADTYEWNFGEGLTSKERDPKVVYKSLGKKSVELIVSDSLTKCRDKIIKEIDIEQVLEFYKFPNVFSPNNDGTNDYFNVAVKPAYKDYVEVVQFKVYNRWGKLIYNNDSPNTGWDGRWQGIDAPVEVYAYFIEIRIRDCNNQVSKGNVTIIR